MPPRVRVRYLLERGRTRNSAGDKPAAVNLFTAALDACARDTLPDADFYRVDVLHMLGIAAPAADQLDWNRKALATAEGSADPRARGWAASLNNNIGWTYFNRGDAATALAHWKKALAQREEAGKTASIRIAKWTVARGLRATGALDDARGDPDGARRRDRARQRAGRLRVRGTRRDRARARRPQGARRRGRRRRTRC